ncbi:hypothetical protein X777_02858 [Ooceraea biroi]|uniref:Uncharacterized protein n=1 Tax=Ooceraea biroi TaxID=2015173 RepID=A0A026WJR0_OOCBI|nr:hypothetical protein X777_02858 [Ooceraea biroi]
MLLHIAAVTVLVNIAIIELDSLYSFPSEELLDMDPSQSEVTSELRRRSVREITDAGISSCTFAATSLVT